MIWLFLSPSHSNSFVHVALIFFSIFSHSLSLVWNRLLFEIIIFSFLRAASNNSTIFSSFFNSLTCEQPSTYELGVRMVDTRRSSTSHRKTSTATQRTDERRKSSDSAGLSHPSPKTEKMPTTSNILFHGTNWSKKKKLYTTIFFLPSILHAPPQCNCTSVHRDSAAVDDGSAAKNSSSIHVFFPLHRSKLSIRFVRYLIIHTLYTFLTIFFLLPLTRLTHHVACRCAAHSV